MKTSIVLALSLLVLISASEPVLFSPQNSFVLSKLNEVKQSVLLNVQSKQVDADLKRYLYQFEEAIEEFRIKLFGVMLNTEFVLEAREAVGQFY